MSVEKEIERIRVAVKRLAKEYEMSAPDAIKFLRGRSSFEIIRGMLGVGNDLTRGAWERFVANSKGEESEVSKLTRERYLQLREEGKTDEQIATEVGWTKGTLDFYRSKWGVTKSRLAVEVTSSDQTETVPFSMDVYHQLREEGRSQPEIARHFGLSLEDLKACVDIERHSQHVRESWTKEQLSTESESKTVAVINIERHKETAAVGDLAPKDDTHEIANDPGTLQYVTVRIPVVIGTPLHDVIDLKRAEAFKTAYHMLEEVISWAAEDLQELLGSLEVDKLQAYIDRQIV